MLSFETLEPEPAAQEPEIQQNHSNGETKSQEQGGLKPENGARRSNSTELKNKVRSLKIPERPSGPDAEVAELRAQMHNQLHADIRTPPERSQIRLQRQDLTSLAEIVEKSIHEAEQAAEKALQLKRFGKELNNRRVQEYVRSHREWKPRIESLKQHLDSAQEKNVALWGEIAFLKRYIEVCTKLEARRLGNDELLEKTIETAKDMIASIEKNGVAISILQNVSRSLEVIEQSNDPIHGNHLGSTRLI